jgi:PAS domain S-box-containing protein
MAEELLSQPYLASSQLQQLVSELPEGVILIDADQSIAWANNVALAMHNVHRVGELGTTVADYRARFDLRYRNRTSLASNDSPVERVFVGATSDDVTVDVSPAGEKQHRSTFRIRSIALTAVEGWPAHLALILSDQTEHLDAEERFERAFAANPAPALILGLADLRYTKVNQGFLEMTGYREADVIGRSAQELDVLEAAEQRQIALERLRERRAIPRTEAWLRLPGAKAKLVLVAGEPIQMDGAACMLFTFADLEPRQQAETALRHSEERFEKAFRLAPVPMAVTAFDDWFRFLFVNGAFNEATGYTDAQATNRTAAELGLWCDPAVAASLERRLREMGSVRDLEVRLRTKDGCAMDCLLSAEVVTIDDRPCALWAMQDVTERRRSEAELAAAIETVMQDTSWFSRTVLEKLAGLRRPASAGAPAHGVSGLTRRGRDVLSLVCQGYDDLAVAERLGLSRTTVRNHVNDLYRRTGTHNRAALVVWARERGFTGEEPTSGVGRRRTSR